MIRLALSLGLSQAGFHAFVASLPVAMVAVGRPDGEIGAIMGSAAIFNLLAALAVGGLIDRYGGRSVFLTGTACMSVAALLFALGIVRPDSSTPELLFTRLLHGVGLAGILPSVASLVPGLVSKARVPTALAFVGVAANVSLAITPPASIALLGSGSLELVGWATLAANVLSMVLLFPVQDPDRQARIDSGMPPSRGFRPAWRPSWAAPLAVTLLFIIHWGVVVGYLPQRAEASGADIGLFFTGDALALLAMRVPAAWLASRIGSFPVVIAGVVITAVSLSLLLLPATTPLLIASGVGTGAGAAACLPTMLIELSHRSDAGDRGSAFGLHSVMFGAGIAIGSVAIAPVYETVGFEVAMLGGIVAVALAGVVALFDGAMRHPPELVPAAPA